MSTAGRKKKPFINKAAARHFQLVTRSDGASPRVLVPVDGDDDNGLGQELQGLALGDEGEEVDEFGFTLDGYDYSQHMRPRGGGTWVPADVGRPVPVEEEAEPEEEDLPSEHMDADVGDLDDDLLAALDGAGDGDLGDDLPDNFVLGILGKEKRDGDSEYGHDAEGDPEDDRAAAGGRQLLEAQVAAMLGEYDAIGDLADEEVQGGTELGEVAGVIDEFWESRKPVPADDLDEPIPLSSEARARLANVEADDDDDTDAALETHPYLHEDRDSDARQWDAETIVTTYTNTENHPTIVRPAPKPRHQRIALSKQGIPVGALDVADVVRAGAVGLVALRRSGDDGDADRGSQGGGAPARPKNEGPEDKRTRKQTVKAERRARREEKKAMRDAFAEERAKGRPTAGRQPTVTVPVV